MPIKKNIYLIGPMGSGKTSVGLQLAKLTQAEFIDIDGEIEQRTGVSVAWIFEKEQEAGFRKRESAIIAELTQQQNIILSTGGGSILAETNRRHLNATGTVVYLTVAIKKQLARTAHRKGVRPLIDTPDPEAKLRQLNRAREPLYRSTADIIIDTNKKTTQAVAKTILATIENGH
jgi:shikimate kinase